MVPTTKVTYQWLLRVLVRSATPFIESLTPCSFVLACSLIRVTLLLSFHYPWVQQTCGSCPADSWEEELLWEKTASHHDPRRAIAFPALVLFRSDNAVCRRVFGLPSEDGRAHIPFEEYPASSSILDASITQSPNATTLP